MELLYAISVLCGVLNVFADAADNAYLPALVSPEQLIQANARLAASSSVARVAGPGLAGLLIDIFRASGAVAVDAMSFLVSAIALSLIQIREPAPETPAERRSIWADIAEGLTIFFRNRVLRAFLAATVTFDLFWNALFAVYFLYVTRDLGLPATAIGVVFGLGSIGALLGAVLTERVIRRFGVGPTIIGTQVILGLTAPLIALPLWLPAVAVPLLAAAEFILSFVGTISGITRGSLIQGLVPKHVLGRVWASRSFIGLGIVPVGALLGGVLGERLGVPATIVIGAFGGIPSFIWLVLSPVRNIRTIATSDDEQSM
jgi:MFS family permease